jgi:WD40 repeat protein
MKLYVRAFLCLLLVAVSAFSLSGQFPVHGQVTEAPLRVTWFVGLGTGTNVEQIEVQQAIVDTWNAEHSDIQVQLHTVNHASPFDVVPTMAASGNPFDIVGPMGVVGRDHFDDLWEDLTPYLEADKQELNMGDFDPIVIERLKIGNRLTSFPMVTFPSVLWVNEDLFKEAGIPLPPTKFGPNGAATYEGKPWDMKALREAGMRLTYDKNGNSAGAAGFDPQNIESYGYSDAWSDFRGWVTHFHTENNGLAADLQTATFDQKPFQDAAKYLHDGIFVDHFIPDSKAVNALNFNPFASGKVAMFSAGSWFTCCLTDAKFNWRLAVPPAAPDGTLTVRQDTDGFSISKGSKDKQAAWRFLKHLNSPAIASQLATIYGGMPSRKSLRSVWETLPNQKKYPQLDNELIYDGVKYADSPAYDAYLPDISKARDLISTYMTALTSDPKIDPVDELKSLNKQLQALFDSTKEKSSSSSYTRANLDQPMITPEITSVAYAPDGKTVLTGRSDGSTRLWNVGDSGVVRTLPKHAGEVLSVAYSPDGKLALTGSADRTARLWDLQSGNLMHSFTGHSAAINGVALSLDGQYALTASSDESVRRWSVERGELLQIYRGIHTPIMDVAFSPDGHSFITGNGDGTTQLWNVESGKPQLTLTGHTKPVLTVAYSPDGKRVLTGSEDDTARLWDAQSGQEIRSLPHVDEVFDVAFSPDGKEILTANCDNITRLWDTETGTLIRALEGHESGVRGAAFSPDGRMIFTGSQDRTARLWDRQANVLSTFPAHVGYMEDVAFTPDGKSVVSASRDEMATVWNAQTGKAIKQIKLASRGLLELAVSPDGKAALSGGEDGTVFLWDIATGDVVHQLQQAAHVGASAPIASLAFSPDGNYAMAGSKDFTITLWSTRTGTRINSWYQYGTGVYSMAFSKDAQTVVVGDYDGMAYLWKREIAGTQDQVKPLTKHKRGVLSVTFAPDSQSVLTSASDSSVYLWEVGADQPSQDFSDADVIVSSLLFAPDRKTFFAGDMDGNIRQVDLATGKTLQTFTAHTEGVTSMAIAPNADTLATAGMDGIVCLWDVQRGKLLHVMQ